MAQSNFRSRARQRVMQALYQWQLTDDDAATVAAQFRADKRDRKESEYFSELFDAITPHIEPLNTLAEPYIDRPLAQMDPVERAILWISLHELQDHPDIPYRVVINEGVELAKRYGGDASHKYINAVLDRAARQLRVDEWTSSH